MPTHNVFLSHNTADKPAVRIIAESLKERGVRVWLDEWELQPGQPWQIKIEEAIESSSATAVFVGPNGIGPWEDVEMRAALDLQVKSKAAVIPIALPGMPRDVKLPLFLRANMWVSFKGIDDEEALDRLYWGITGTKPKRRIGPRHPSSGDTGVHGDPVEAAIASLVGQLQSRNITYFIGSTKQSVDLELPPDNDELARAIFEDLALGQVDAHQIVPPVDLAGTCYATRSGDRSLEDRVRELVINRSYQIPQTHRLLARLLKLLKSRPRSRSRRQDPQLIVTTNFDLLIELSLLAEGVPFSRIVQRRSDTDVLVNVYDKFESLGDGRIEVSEDGRTRVIALDDLEEIELWIAKSGARKVPAADVSFSKLVDPILYKHHGSHDIENSCVISTDHYLDFIHRAARQGFVPTDVENVVENSPAALFLGYNPLDPDFRLLYHVLLSDRWIGGRTFRYSPLSVDWEPKTASCRGLARHFWSDFKASTQEQMGITILDESPEQFIAKLVDAVVDVMDGTGASPD